MPIELRCWRGGRERHRKQVRWACNKIKFTVHGSAVEDDQGSEKPTVAVLSKRESGPKQGDTGKKDKSNVTNVHRRRDRSGQARGVGAAVGHRQNVLERRSKVV